MKNNTFSVLVLAKTAKSIDGQAPVYVRVTINGKRKEVSLKCKADASLWCSIRGLSKGKSISCRKLNQKIEDYKSGLNDAYHQLVREHKAINAESVVNTFLGIDENNYTLSALMDYHNTTMVHQLKPGTMKNYHTTQRFINEFLKKEKKTTDIYLNHLRFNFVVDFEIFLKNRVPTDHQRPCGQNGANKHIERLRKMINLAIKNEWLDKDPFARYQKKYVKSERQFLTPQQLGTLEDKTFVIPRLSQVRDLFVFSCYTGLAYVDVMSLTSDNISIGIDGEWWLHFSRKKTGTSVNLPLLPKAYNLIKKYQTHPKVVANHTLFPKYSNQRMNSYLKEIQDLCGIATRLTFHIARHTFATTVTLSNGVPIETVSKMLGHTKLSTTQVYARVLKSKISNDMQVLKQKLGKACVETSQNHPNKKYN